MPLASVKLASSTNANKFNKVAAVNNVKVILKPA